MQKIYNLIKKDTKKYFKKKQKQSRSRNYKKYLRKISIEIIFWHESFFILIPVGFKAKRKDNYRKYENVNKVVPKTVDIVIKDNKIQKKEVVVEKPKEITLNETEKIETPVCG